MSLSCDTSDLDTYRTAWVLLDQHDGDGELASLDAAMRSDELLDGGDLEGAKVWRRVIEAVEELGREEPREGETQH